MHIPNQIPWRPDGQQGAVLLISLIILLIVTLIGTTALQTITLEEKMTANIRDYNIAFQGAEAALRRGESQLAIWPPPLLKPIPDNNGQMNSNNNQPLPYIWRINAPHPAFPNVNSVWWREGSRDGTWWRSQVTATKAYDYADPIHYLNDFLSPGNQSRNPVFLFEYQRYVKDDLGWCSYEYPCTGKDYFRVTARSIGGSDDAVVLLQSMFAWRYN